MHRGGWGIVGLLLFACSGSTPSATPASDAGAEASLPRVDAGGEAGDACTRACGTWCSAPLTAIDIFPFEENDWAPPSPPHGACSESELAAIEGVLATSAHPTRSQLENAVATTCGACILSVDWSDEWGPFVSPRQVVGRGDSSVLFNLGACHAIHEGAACGRAFTLEHMCKLAVCGECTAEQRDACFAAAESDACRELTPARKAACPAHDTTQVRCANMMDVVRLLCAAGADAGASDGG